MKYRLQVHQLGNEKVVFLPVSLLDRLNLYAGDVLEVEVTGTRLPVGPVSQNATLEALLSVSPAEGLTSIGDFSGDSESNQCGPTPEMALFHKALSVWESYELAIRWLANSVPALNGDKPIELFSTLEERERVSLVLDKIEHY